MSEKAQGILLAILVALVVGLFVAIGGEGSDLEEHAAWMAATRERGTLVMW